MHLSSHSSQLILALSILFESHRHLIKAPSPTTSGSPACFLVCPLCCPLWLSLSIPLFPTSPPTLSSPAFLSLSLLWLFFLVCSALLHLMYPESHSISKAGNCVVWISPLLLYLGFPGGVQRDSRDNLTTISQETEFCGQENPRNSNHSCYTCRNPWNGGTTWRATVTGAAKSRTRLQRLHITFSDLAFCLLLILFHLFLFKIFVFLCVCS